MPEIAPSPTRQPDANGQLLTFIVNGDEYGVDILRVQEIRGWSTPMPIPNAPAFIKGVINIRGDIVPIADLRERLSMPRLEYGPTTVIIVLRVLDGVHEKVMGVIVDAMSDVTNLPKESIKPSPVFDDGGTASLVRGIATMNEKMLTILDVDSIFATPGVAKAHP